MDVHMPNVILDATLDEDTTLNVACHEIEWLKLEDERTKYHHAMQLRAANERHVAEVENLHIMDHYPAPEEGEAQVDIPKENNHELGSAHDQSAKTHAKSI